MAEGFSLPTPDSTENTSVTDVLLPKKRPDGVDRFKQFIGDLFRPKEKLDDNETPERKKKKGRFAAAWRRLFLGNVVDKEELPTKETPARGLFFEKDPIQAQPTTPEQATVSTAETVVQEEQPSIETTEQSEVSEAPKEQVVEIPLEPTEKEQVLYTDRTRPHNQPRPVVYRETIVHKEAPEPVKVVQEAAPERKQDIPVQEKIIVPKPPERIVHKEVQQVTVEKLVPQPPERAPQKPEVTFKKEVIYNVTPELQKSVEKHEAQEANEIAYELSHEHKDMGKQSWTAMQQAAYAQSQANAAALAAAKSAANDDKKAKKGSAQGPQTVYQRTVTSAFVTLAILFAFIIVILLIQSK